MVKPSMPFCDHLNEILDLTRQFLLLIQHCLSAETVVYRIFYCLSRIGSGLLTLRELKRGNLLDALRHADDEEDINKVLRWHIQIKILHPLLLLFLIYAKVSFL
jgi:hypothetical protein